MSKDRGGDAAGGMGALRSSWRFVKEADAWRCVKSLAEVNRPDGFDCPGCAWPEPSPASRMEFCENGVKAVAAETTAKRVTREFFARHTVSELRQHSDFWLEDQGRLTEPMGYDPASDHYVPLSWDEAFAQLGQALRGCAHPDRAMFYTSGRTSNEAAFMLQLFARKFGTNNMPDCSNLCHESSGVALSQSIGVGKGTVTIEDFEQAEAIFVIGQNPGTNHPRMLAELQKAARRGATIVSVNPLRERGLEAFIHPKEVLPTLFGKGTPIASMHLQPLVGGDLALLKGLVKCVFEAGPDALDLEFVEAHTTGFDRLRRDVGGLSWSHIETQSGLGEAAIREAARVYIESDATIVCWAMGLTQHRFAVETIQYITNLLLLRGNLGKPGAGACPVRGHSNVQGDRTMGITSRPKAAFLDKLGEVFGFEPPRGKGADAVEAIQAMAAGEVDVLFCMGGNLARAVSDSHHAERAMRRAGLGVHVATKLNQSHLQIGRSALLLPCLGRTERDQQAGGTQSVTVEDSMSVVHASTGRRDPASLQLLSEPAIVAGMAAAALDEDWSDWVADYSRIRERIESVVPGFERYNERIKEPGGFYLGSTAADRDWRTASGKAEILVHPLPDLTLPDGQLRLMTLRSHDQYNTTIYGMDDRYRGISGKRDIILMNAADIEARGLSEGARARVRSHYPDGDHRELNHIEVLAYDIPAGCAAMYFPEANPLISIHANARVSNTPVSKFVPVTVRAQA